MSPRVSICIPAYDQVECLGRALDSIAVQDYSNFEVVITDDSPDDSISRVLSDYPFSDRIHYFKNAERRGSPGNWNEAVARASGEYIKILHHDDWFSQADSLSRYVALLDEAPEANLAFSATRIVDARDGSESFHFATREQVESLRKDPAVLFFGNFVGSPSATIYRARSAQDFDENLKWLVDIDHYIRTLGMNDAVAYSEEVLISTLGHAPHRVTSECLDNPQIDVAETFYLYRKHTLGDSDRRRQFIAHLGDRVERANLNSVAAIRSAGYAGPVPPELARRMLRRRIVDALFATPLRLTRRASKGFLPESIKRRIQRR